jgi:hypothetical protein
MSRKKKEELLFVAECTSDQGKPPRSAYVYKSGSAFILRSGGHSYGLSSEQTHRKRHQARDRPRLQRDGHEYQIPVATESVAT